MIEIGAAVMIGLTVAVGAFLAGGVVGVRIGVEEAYKTLGVAKEDQ